MIALCSKTYALQDNNMQCKTALKGLNKNFLQNPLELCKEVLKTGCSQYSTNKSFRVRDNTMFTYEQKSPGLGNFYCKRELVDGVHT